MMKSKMNRISLSRAKPSDLNIGLVYYLDFGGELSRGVLRSRLTLPVLRKLKIGHPKEETLEEYVEYKRIIKKYAEDGNLLIEKR